MAATSIIEDLATKARLAARVLANSSNAQRNQILENISLELEKNSKLIIEANQLDMEAAKKSGMNQSLQDRLLLTEARIKSMANAAKNITKLPDPLNRVLVERTLENGLHLLQKSVPFGVDQMSQLMQQ
jgi:glutamate-5-semialdehyde dehydrogenase